MRLNSSATGIIVASSDAAPQAAAEGAVADRLVAVGRRIADGTYLTPAVLDAVAERLRASGAV